MSTLIESLPEDFSEKVNKKILITGAGFSKIAGGFLASEIANRIFNYSSVSQSIKNKILSHDCNYERVYDDLTGVDSKCFEESLINIFRDMDKGIQNPSIDNMVGFANHCEKFYGLFSDKDKYNFILTLNQDTVLERCYLHYANKRQGGLPAGEYTQEITERNIRLNFPYNSYRLEMMVVTKSEKEHSPKNYAVQAQNSYEFNDFIQHIEYDSQNIPKISSLNYLKLHGSAHWRNSEGAVAITGVNKVDKISRFKELNASIEMFDKLIVIRDLKIVIVGYGFKDAHVNERILKAIDNGSRLYIINPMSFDRFASRDNTIEFNLDKCKSCHAPLNILKKRNKLLAGIEQYFPVEFSAEKFFNKDEGFKLLEKTINYSDK